MSIETHLSSCQFGSWSQLKLGWEFERISVLFLGVAFSLLFKFVPHITCLITRDFRPDTTVHIFSFARNPDAPLKWKVMETLSETSYPPWSSPGFPRPMETPRTALACSSLLQNHLARLYPQFYFSQTYLKLLCVDQKPFPDFPSASLPLVPQKLLVTFISICLYQISLFKWNWSIHYIGGVSGKGLAACVAGVGASVGLS